MNCEILLFFVIVSIVYVNGHGRLMEPPARNCMWRFGFENPVNYNDNENYCGGYVTQFQKNEGKCGVCGDNYADESPRDHEAGGKFGNGILVRRYSIGQTISIQIELTTNHWGYFLLKLCPIEDKNTIPTQECFDRHQLKVVDDDSSDRFVIPSGSKKSDVFDYKIKLPDGLSCNRCVMQWTYITGNTWGDCGNGTSAVGCGPQENFVNCADIQIFTNIPGAIPPLALESIANPNAIYYRDSNSFNRNQLVVNHQICIPTENFAPTRQSEQWCQRNCLQYPPNCPRSKCSCLTDCKAIGELEGIEGTDVFCHRNCLRYPATSCPKDKCKCTSSTEDQELEETILNINDEKNPEEESNNDVEIIDAPDFRNKDYDQLIYDY